MRILKALLLPFLLILSLIGVDRLSGKHKTIKHPQPLWERACSRRRQHCRYLCQLTHRFREQARSHKGTVVCT